VVILTRRAAAVAAMRPALHFKLERVECHAVEAELVLVRLRWRTHEFHEGEVSLGLPMSLQEEQTKEFAVKIPRELQIGRERQPFLIYWN
jgi:hypothetical protein